MAMQVAQRSTDITVAAPRGGSTGCARAQIYVHCLNHKTQLKLQTERGTLFLSLSSRDGAMGIIYFLLILLLPKLSCLFFFVFLIDCGFSKSFLNLLGVDRFFVLIF